MRVQSKTPPEGGTSTVPSTPDGKKKSPCLIRGELPKFQPHQPQPPGAVPQKPQKPRSSERRRRAPRHPLLLLQGQHPHDLEPVARALAHTRTPRHTSLLTPSRWGCAGCWQARGLIGGQEPAGSSVQGQRANTAGAAEFPYDVIKAGGRAGWAHGPVC